MLTLNPATTGLPLEHVPRIGLAVAGGGPLGAIYELGALYALDEALDGIQLNALDVYVGVSAGSFLAASLANQVSTTQMCRIFMGTPGAEFAFEPGQFLRPALDEYLKRIGNLPGALLDLAREAARHPARLTGMESMAGLSRLIPTGIFDNRTIDRFLVRVLEREGRSNDFRELSTILRVVAVDLDTGQAVRFGETGRDHVPISRTVQASAALPGLYPPVEIDGRFYVDGALRRTLHASVALREGTDLLFAINPLVPFDADPARSGAAVKSRMVRGGLPQVLSQTFRALIQSRMQIGMSKYASEFPAASLMLIEPNRDDEKMFFTNIFSYSGRSRLAEHAYRTTRAELLARAQELEAFLGPYGLSINRDTLSKDLTLFASLESRPRNLSVLGDNLARALDRLEHILEQNAG